MELWIEGKKENDSGMYIYCKIGKTVRRSYFTNPSKSIDHADLKYIQERYNFISTDKRVREFKQKYKELFQ